MTRSSGSYPEARNVPRPCGRLFMRRIAPLCVCPDNSNVNSLGTWFRSSNYLPQDHPSPRYTARYNFCYAFALGGHSTSASSPANLRSFQSRRMSEGTRTVKHGEGLLNTASLPQTSLPLTSFNDILRTTVSFSLTRAVGTVVKPAQIIYQSTFLNVCKCWCTKCE